jgi:hypothetical protein
MVSPRLAAVLLLLLLFLPGRGGGICFCAAREKIGGTFDSGGI